MLLVGGQRVATLLLNTFYLFSILKTVRLCMSLEEVKATSWSKQSVQE